MMQHRKMPLKVKLLSNAAFIIPLAGLAIIGFLIYTFFSGNNVLGISDSTVILIGDILAGCLLLLILASFVSMIIRFVKKARKKNEIGFLINMMIGILIVSIIILYPSVSSKVGNIFLALVVSLVSFGLVFILVFFVMSLLMRVKGEKLSKITAHNLILSSEEILAATGGIHEIKHHIHSKKSIPENKQPQIVYEFPVLGKKRNINVKIELVRLDDKKSWKVEDVEILPFQRYLIKEEDD